MPFIYALAEATMRAYVEQVWGAYSPELTRKSLGDAIAARTFSVVTHDGRDVGAIAVERHDSHIQLAQLYIHPAHQNQGIGTHLVRELIAEARATRKPLRLRVLSSNPARALYEREGFRVTAQTPERYFMELDVSSPAVPGNGAA